MLDTATNFRGATWEPDGTILYGKDGGVWAVSADGGQPELVVPIEEGWANTPQMLPDGHTVLFTLLDGAWLEGNRGWESPEIVAQDLDSGSREVLVSVRDPPALPGRHAEFDSSGIEMGKLGCVRQVVQFQIHG